jgi:NAD(P)-dependent dehydrogenase (short-subunit alcohol dehydrogenase family)
LFQEVYAVNVFGTVAVTESMRPLLNRGGTIVDVWSAIRSLALLLKTPGMPEYSSSKTALKNLTVQWAKKNGSGTRVVSICPGAFSASSSASKNLGPGQLGQHDQVRKN